jgi:hypothetical protein
MSVLKVFFDESGNNGQPPATVVSGFVFAADKWVKFESEWKKRLQEDGLDYFHMVDFAQSVKQFDGWERDEERRRGLMGSLIDIVSRSVECAVSNAIRVDAFNEVNSKYCLEESLGPQYALCARICVDIVRKWTETSQLPWQETEYFFEHGATGAGKLIETMERDDLPKPIFLKKRELGALQAADILAYENLKGFKQEKENDWDTARKPIKMLLARIPNVISRTEQDGLEEICAELHIPQRLPFSFST